MNRIDDNAATVTPATTPPTAPILITEQEVMLGTAAALGTHPATTHWWSQASGIARAALHRRSARPTADEDQPVHHPERYGFLEQSCLAREMRRL
ncbi:MAG TPA: hypothetical protein VL179_09765 [Mycobacterium sp.]|nr:hypothetical protein [Mycobacterium sp.]